jgi:hypothetical protein
VATTVSAEVTNILPKTEQDLTTHFTASPTYTQIKASAIDRAKLRLYRGASVPAESGMDERIIYLLADMASVNIIEAAVDYYKSQMLAENVDEANVTYYDKIAALTDKRDRLTARIERELPDVLDLLAPTFAAHKVPLVTSRGRQKMTRNPWSRVEPWR